MSLVGLRGHLCSCRALPQPCEGPGIGALGWAGALSPLQDPSWEQSPLPEFQQPPWLVLALHQPRDDTRKDSWRSRVEPTPQASTQGCPTYVGNPCPAGVPCCIHWTGMDWPLDDASLHPGQRLPACLSLPTSPLPQLLPSLTRPLSQADGQSPLPRRLWGCQSAILEGAGSSPENRAEARSWGARPSTGSLDAGPSASSWLTVPFPPPYPGKAVFSGHTPRAPRPLVPHPVLFPTHPAPSSVLSWCPRHLHLITIPPAGPALPATLPCSSLAHPVSLETEFISVCVFSVHMHFRGHERKFEGLLIYVLSAHEFACICTRMCVHMCVCAHVCWLHGCAHDCGWCGGSCACV